MKYSAKGIEDETIETIILDLNGTLSVHGKIPGGVKERIAKLRDMDIKVILFTGDQRGTAADLCAEYGIEFIRTSSTEEKEQAILKFNSETTAAIGNARIDIGTFKHAKVSIATLQAEGIHTGILEYVDVIVPSINDALDFFIDPNIYGATMRR
jgi:P-type E1-E2 ATPase